MSPPDPELLDPVLLVVVEPPPPPAVLVVPADEPAIEVLLLLLPPPAPPPLTNSPTWLLMAETVPSAGATRTVSSTARWAVSAAACADATVACAAARSPTLGACALTAFAAMVDDRVPCAVVTEFSGWST